MATILKFPWFIQRFIRRYKATKFSLHYSIKYFKNNNCLSSIYFEFFSILCVLLGRTSRETCNIVFKCPNITKGNSNVHFIFGRSVRDVS